MNEAFLGRYDLIIMGSQGMGGVKRFNLDNVSEEVVKRAKIPVLVVRAREKRRGWRRILEAGG